MPNAKIIKVQTCRDVFAQTHILTFEVSVPDDKLPSAVIDELREFAPALVGTTTKGPPVEGHRFIHIGPWYPKIMTNAQLLRAQEQLAAELVRRAELHEAALRELAEDLASNRDHEHRSRGSVKKGECDGYPACIACQGDHYLEQLESQAYPADKR